MAPLSERYADTQSYSNQESLNRSCHSAMNQSLPVLSSLNAAYRSNLGRRTIAFSPTVTIFEVLHIGDYTMEEVQHVWYSRREIATIGRETKETTTLMMAGVNFCDDGDRYCARGLESETDEGSHQMAHRIQEARDAVFDEQNLQLDENMYDPELLADIYFHCTSACQQEARHRASLDENDAAKDGTRTQHRFLPKTKVSLQNKQLYALGNECQRTHGSRGISSFPREYRSQSCF
jgi:hypothetical protein